MATFTSGCRSFEVPHEPDPIHVIVLYPAETPELPQKLGPYAMDLAKDAPITPGEFPLVVVSHGTGGSPLTHRNLARFLTRNGFIVALVEHPRNNRDNNELAGTAQILQNRPQHIRSVIDFISSHQLFAATLRPGWVALIGHSLGGYTALAAAGGEATSFPHENADQKPRPIQTQADERIKALVLLAPATAWFMAPGALRNVHAPILMITAEKDPHTPAWHADLVTNGIADRRLLKHRVVVNAGHFAFLSPFPPEMSNAGFPASQDPVGFDRPKFQAELCVQVLAFLTSAL